MDKHNGNIPEQAKTEQKEKSLSSENIFTPRKRTASLLRQKYVVGSYSHHGRTRNVGGILLLPT